MCLGPAQSTRKEGLPSPSVGNQIMWQFGMMSDWKVYFHLVFFWDLLYKKAQDFRKYSGNWQLFLVEIWVSCCQTVWCILIVGRCFTLKPTRGSALNSDFFLTARDVMMDRWDPSNSGVHIGWKLMVGRRIFPSLKWSNIQWTFNGHSTFFRLLGVFLLGLRHIQTPGSFSWRPLQHPRRSGEMPAEFSSLTAAEQQALMDASMSGQKSLKGRWILWGNDSWSFCSSPKFWTHATHRKKLGPPNTIFWVSMRKTLVLVYQILDLEAASRTTNKSCKGRFFQGTLTGVRVAGKLEVKPQWFSLLLFPENGQRFGIYCNPKEAVVCHLFGVFDSQLSTHDRSDMTEIACGFWIDHIWTYQHLQNRLP